MCGKVEESSLWLAGNLTWSSSLVSNGFDSWLFAALGMERVALLHRLKYWALFLAKAQSQTINLQLQTSSFTPLLSLSRGVEIQKQSTYNASYFAMTRSATSQFSASPTFATAGLVAPPIHLCICGISFGPNCGTEI